jgi:hypothetical protein
MPKKNLVNFPFTLVIAVHLEHGFGSRKKENNGIRNTVLKYEEEKTAVLKFTSTGTGRECFPESRSPIQMAG